MPRKAFIKITPQLLRQLLILPKEIAGTLVAYDPADNAVVLTVEGAHLKDVADGEPTPMITPVYETVGKKLRLREISGYNGPMTRVRYR